MVKTKWKPESEIKYLLKNKNKVSILSCDCCAKEYGTGGIQGIEVLKTLMDKWNKKVLFSDVVFTLCIEDLTRHAIETNQEYILKSDALVLASCASGIKTAYLCRPHVPLAGVLDTLGCGLLTQKDNTITHTLCTGCKQCVINYTDGICPVAICPAQKKYGPCRNAPKSNRKCSIDPETDCIWSEIIRKGDMSSLATLSLLHKNDKKGVFVEHL